MRSIKSWLPLAALVVIICQHQQALANEVTSHYCHWDSKQPSGPMTFTRDLGTVHVPRDARVGRLLGIENNQAFTPNPERARLVCNNDGTQRYTFTFSEMQALVPVPGFDGPVMPTNVPGIGARVRIGSPFNNLNDSHFVPIGEPFVPFQAVHNRQSWLTEFAFTHLSHRITLVKTGDTPLGIHNLDTPLFSGHLDHPNIGHAFIYYLKGQIRNTECSLSGSGVSANPVLLGDWATSDFTGVGFVTRPTPFQIVLSGCQIDPDRNTYATIEFAGVNGSVPIGPPSDGVFGLTGDSGAEGVGIRLLGDGGSPVPLQTEVELVPLNDGTTTLNFAAQFIQTKPSNAVRAGLAKGALNFIVRYR
ncbi:type 1 fimbrial protein [Pseudomonas sp. SWRI59]|uniref:fimbrial protein n=1 Tax=Pseudomonas TaxID=286 RepID=UPI001645AC6A|nr:MULTISPECIES: fimbrial protein [unclassified Pseudomonas]MBC3500396.1 type 1 fimbrial protein [Pseudomonas sp. SWRI59]MBC3507930.1 type 1 fimbrial protein [Pseudomonas sp. SWRI68]